MRSGITLSILRMPGGDHTWTSDTPPPVPLLSPSSGGVEEIPLVMSAQNPRDANGVDEDAEAWVGERSLTAALKDALARVRGEWIAVLDEGESLHAPSLEAVLRELTTSAEGLRHGRVLLRNPQRTAQEEVGRAPSCSYASMLRWWSIGDIPHPAGLFIRRALLEHVLTLAPAPSRFNRYEVGVLASRGGRSHALTHCSSEGIFTPERASVEEQERIRATQMEIAQLSPSEQADLWRQYYQWCAEGRGRGFTPAMLPLTRAHAQGLASMLGSTSRSVFEALWCVYRDIERSKQAAVVLARWGLLGGEAPAADADVSRHQEVAEYIATELQRRDMTNLLCISERLGCGPAPALAKLLRSLGRFEVGISAVSTKGGDDRHVVSSLARSGLLGPIRNVRATSESSESVSVTKLIRRAVDEFQGEIDCVTVAADSAEIEAQVLAVTRHVTVPFQIVVHGPNSGKVVSRIQEVVSPHTPCSLARSDASIAVLRCGEPLEAS